MNTVKAIFYDLDGVLVDACDWHYHSLNDALEKHCGFRITYEEHVKTYNGLSTKIKLKMLELDKSTAQKVWATKQEKTLENIKKFGFKDNYKRKLHRWTQSQGIHSVCVTNSIRETTLEMLKITEQLEYMEFIVSNENVKNNKPAPDCYLLALEKIGFNKDEVVIIEDSPKGKQSAYASGIRVLEVKDAFDVTLDFVRRKINENFNTNGR